MKKPLDYNRAEYLTVEDVNPYEYDDNDYWAMLRFESEATLDAVTEWYWEEAQEPWYGKQDI